MELYQKCKLDHYFARNVSGKEVKNENNTNMPTQGLPPVAMTGFVSTTEWRSISGKISFFPKLFKSPLGLQ